MSFDVNDDPNDNDFSDWLASKFNNHKTMDRDTKNLLWVHWMRGEDKETETENESLYDDSTLTDNMEELFSIDIDVFDYETPFVNNSRNSTIFFKSISIYLWTMSI